MKYIIFYVLNFFLFSFSDGSGLYGQDTIKSLPPVIVKATTTKIPPKVWKGFSGYFNDAEMPISWYRINKDYLVKFMIYDEQNRALFSKKGRLIYRISYGYEKSLPDDIREQLKTNYAAYKIIRAIKVTEAGREVWVVSLETSDTLMLVRIEEDELEVLQTIKISS